MFYILVTLNAKKILSYIFINEKLMKVKKKYFLIIFSLFVFFEFFSFVFSKLNLLVFNDTPIIYVKNKKNIIDNYWTEKEIWGAWHEKNFFTTHKKNCFEVNYKTNEVGARDNSFQELKHQNNIILLGDSFAEGYGVDKNEMFEVKIENNLKKNVLNFSSSKDFGLIQYFILYEHLARNYQHDTIIISFLPNNDFKDNDYIYYKNNKFDFVNNNKRHRPYYKKIDNEYKIIYPSNFKKVEQKFINFFEKYFWSSNTLRTIKFLYISEKTKNIKKELMNNEKMQNKNSFHITDYYFTPLYQQEAIIFFIKKFVEKYSNKKIILFTIPLYEDYEIIKNEDYREKIYWWSNLKQLEKNYNNFYFLDLFDYANDEYNEFFFPNKCDGHWNSKGNKWAGEVISNYLFKSVF